MTFLLLSSSHLPLFPFSLFSDLSPSSSFPSSSFPLPLFPFSLFSDLSPSSSFPSSSFPLPLFPPPPLSPSSSFPLLLFPFLLFPPPPLSPSSPFYPTSTLPPSHCCLTKCIFCTQDFQLPSCTACVPMVLPLATS